MRSNLITVTTDFGLNDPYAAIMKGAAIGINSQVRFVDITHDIPLGNVSRASFFISTCVNWFPQGTVHLAVVDPDVGTDRRPIAVQGKRHFYVGPDNGIFTMALRHDKIVSAVELRPGNWTLGRISKTFHGRDIFAPAAAYLSMGVGLENLGPEISDLVELDIPSVQVKNNKIETVVLHIDTYGNLIVAVRCDSTGIPVDNVQIKGQVIPLNSTFADVPVGHLTAYWGSSGYCEVAVNRGSAAEALSVQVGDPVTLQLMRL